DLVGGKASNLLWLKEANMCVPDFFVITTEAHHYFLKNQKLPKELLEKLTSFLKAHSDQKFAVRSSVTGEDGVQHSFAGLFETYLDCNQSEIEDKIKEAYLSI